MFKTIPVLKNNIKKQDDDLIPFPRAFAECVAGIFAYNEEDDNCSGSHEARTFVSTTGLILR